MNGGATGAARDLPREPPRLLVASTAARMFYLAGQSTQEIADYLKVSRSTVSRLLAFAREAGVVEVRVHEAPDNDSRITTELLARFPHVRFHVLGVHDGASGGRIHAALAQYAAQVVADMVEPDMTIGLAWGNTVSGLIDHLRPKSVRDLRVVQLNGASDSVNSVPAYAFDIIARFAQNFGASYRLFPVPVFFDHPETREALWKERSIQRILALQEQADMLLFSTSALGHPSSYVHVSGHLADHEVADLRAAGVVGDIGTVFFDNRGRADLPINRRASGPPLSLYARSRRSVCVASGASKVPGLTAILAAGCVTDLIVDSRTAAEMVRRMQPRPGNRG